MHSNLLAALLLVPALALDIVSLLPRINEALLPTAGIPKVPLQSMQSKQTPAEYRQVQAKVTRMVNAAKDFTPDERKFLFSVQTAFNKQSRAYGLYLVGDAFQNGVAVDVNMPLARQYFKLAHDLGSHDAGMALAKMYRLGLGGKQNIRAAKNIESRLEGQDRKRVRTVNGISDPNPRLPAALRGNDLDDLEKVQSKILTEISNRHAKKQRIFDPSEPALIEKLARNGNTQAKYLMGVILVNGLGIQKNEPAGLNWFIDAAQYNHPESIQILNTLSETNTAASFFLANRFAAQNNQEAAVGLLEQTVTLDARHREALFKLSEVYLKSELLDTRIRGIDYLKRAAGLHYQPAELQLAKEYLSGKNIPASVLEAVKLLARLTMKGDKSAKSILTVLADRGSPEANTWLGYIRLNGFGTPKSVFQARDMLESASDKHVIAANLLMAESKFSDKRMHDLDRTMAMLDAAKAFVDFRDRQ